MRVLRLRGYIVSVLLLVILAGLAGSANAMQTEDVADLQETVEAIETQIADAQLDGVPRVAELDQQEFDDLVTEIRDGDPVYGPVDDQLVHDPEFIRLSWAPGYYANFMLEATFGNPHEDEDATFDFGIEFRINGDYTNPSRMYLVVDDAGSWMAAVGTDDQWSDATEFSLGDGRYRRLNDEPGEENQLTVVVDGGELHFAINGEYVTSLGVPQTGVGGLAVGTGFYAGNAPDDAVTPITDFTVWEL